MNNAAYIKKVKATSTPEAILQLLIEADNDSILGFDPYYRDLRTALFDQAKKILGTQHSTVQLARDAATYAAWLDLFCRFTPAQRKDFANLLAHDWTISAVEFESEYGGTPNRKVAEIDIATGLKENKERLARQQAARIRARQTG